MFWCDRDVMESLEFGGKFLGTKHSPSVNAKQKGFASVAWGWGEEHGHGEAKRGHRVVISLWARFN